MRLPVMWHGFTARTVLAALGMHMLLAVAIGYGTYRIISDDLKDEYINAVRSQAHQFGLSIGGYANSPAAVEAMLQDALLGGQVVSAELVLDSGRILPTRAARTDRSGFVEDFSFDA